MNLASMKRRVYAVLRDSEKAFVLDENVEDWLNESYLDVAARTRCLRKEVTGSTTAAGSVTLPADYLQTEWLSVDDSNGNETKVEFVDNQVFDSWRLGGGTPTNQLARIYNGAIETYPVAVSVSYTLRYVYEPTPMSAGSDEPDLPSELHIRLVNYARAHAKYQEGELEEGDRYMALYEAGMPGPPLAGLREKPGPFDLRPPSGFWEES